MEVTQTKYQEVYLFFLFFRIISLSYVFKFLSFADSITIITVFIRPQFIFLFIEGFTLNSAYSLQVSFI